MTSMFFSLHLFNCIMLHACMLEDCIIFHLQTQTRAFTATFIKNLQISLQNKWFVRPSHLVCSFFVVDMHQAVNNVLEICIYQFLIN